jgi:SAM-dependent methyltransferase
MTPPENRIDSHAPQDQSDLSRIYSQRFQANLEYRKKVWQILVTHFFSRYIPPDSTILDLGCGYGEFINTVPAKKRLAMDLNSDAPRHLDPTVTFLHQDCSRPWPDEAQTLDIVFTSNFFEHLPDKTSLALTLDQIHRALRPGGRLIAMGPNIRCIPHTYWDFWDHYIPLSERSLGEALENRHFRIIHSHARFLPYTMAGKKPAPQILIKAYLKLPIAWRLLGHQFLIIAEK